MSTRPPNNSTGPFDHMALRYLRQALDMTHPTDEPYVLNPTEYRVIRRTKTVILTMAALLGVVSILLFYWPQYIWPDLFSSTSLVISGLVYQIPLASAVYSLLLIYINVYMLIALNLWGVRVIMHICQFPQNYDSQYDRHLQALTNTILKKKRQAFGQMGVNPYINMPRWGLSLFFLITVVKAFLSSLSVKLFLKLFVSRYLLQQLTQVVSMPIFAAWNAWASWQVLHEAQIRVMAPTTIREFVHELYEEWGKNDQFRLLVLESLEYMAILEQQYNYAHFILTETLVDRFDLKADVILTGSFTEHILQAPVAIRKSLERLIVFEVLIDGNLTWLKKRRLQELRKRGIITYSSHDIKRMSDDYNQGHGLWV